MLALTNSPARAGGQPWPVECVCTPHSSIVQREVRRSVNQAALDMRRLPSLAM